VPAGSQRGQSGTDYGGKGRDVRNSLGLGQSQDIQMADGLNRWHRDEFQRHRKKGRRLSRRQGVPRGYDVEQVKTFDGGSDQEKAHLSQSNGGQKSRISEMGCQD